MIKKTVTYKPKAYEPSNSLNYDDPRWPGVNISITMYKVITEVANDLGIELSSLQIGGAIREDEGSTVSLYTNYDVRQMLPLQEDTERYDIRHWAWPRSPNGTWTRRHERWWTA